MYVIYFFFFNDTATTEIYTLSLHDALPIFHRAGQRERRRAGRAALHRTRQDRSEEHTSELQSQFHLVCRLLLEKKKKNKNQNLHMKQQILKNKEPTITYIQFIINISSEAIN